MNDIDPCLILSGQVAYAWTSGIAYLVSAVTRWTSAEAERLVKETVALSGNERHTFGSISRFLGPVPGAAERKSMAAALDRHYGKRTEKTVLLSDSGVMRGVLTAWSWVMPTSVRAYPPNAIGDAILWVSEGHEVDVQHVDRVAHACNALLAAAQHRHTAG